MAERKLRLGVAGLGRAFTIMLPTFVKDPRVQLVAAADSRDDARRKFAADFGATAYASVEELCADAAVEAIYVATPTSIMNGMPAWLRPKASTCWWKPMALTLTDCRAMIAAARSAGVQLVVGHSHSFDGPVRARGKSWRAGRSATSA